MLTYFFVYITVINGIALYLMYIDKRKAMRNQYRISEKTLWTVSFIGGAFGAFVGMKWFRHKTKHNQFKWGLPVLSIAEMAIILYFFYING